MKLYLQQRVFSIGDKFTLYDEGGNDRYYVQGEVFSFGKRLHILDTEGRELAMIRQKVFSFLPTYFVDINGQEIARIVKKFTIDRKSVV